MGATRFDVAVRALRGELDPPEWIENTERSSGVLLSALYQFPRSYIFQVVGRPTTAAAEQAAGGRSGGGKEAFVGDVTAAIARVTQAEVEDGKVEVKERLGGKYLSVSVDVVVRAPELVGMVYDELAKDPRVIMKF
ncbi:hypothetical protein GPECTOR_13g760 [Gonium pectorale]|uniref:Uncharacterized protein n=1 Tax=Gonium pectorale TaxID=33097 RepID=A0A150GN57_GONPE|nr:hypothetical protein GPECTOR_13g760 [Gonium pectorale]|eukprot:KXZ51273.1 hypothetical protein GPECTOR_13g760 [Gonium pectorale]